eukprot:1867428-Rhodomonas_salina.2
MRSWTRWTSPLGGACVYAVSSHQLLPRIASTSVVSAHEQTCLPSQRGHGRGVRAGARHVPAPAAGRRKRAAKHLGGPAQRLQEGLHPTAAPLPLSISVLDPSSSTSQSDDVGLPHLQAHNLMMMSAGRRRSCRGRRFRLARSRLLSAQSAPRLAPPLICNGSVGAGGRLWEEGKGQEG